MRAFLPLAFSHLLVTVWAGGYQSGLERIWLFKAYEIDGLNAEADQTIGMRCNNFKPNLKTPACKEAWIPCVGKSSSRCNFDEFMDFLQQDASAAPQDPNNPAAPKPQTKWGVFQGDKLDVQKTAINIFKLSKGRGSPEVPPHQMMKSSAVGYPEFVKMVSKTVDDTYKKHGSVGDPRFWQEFDQIREDIKTARVGDHGPHLIKAANEDEKLKTYQLEIKHIGKHPANESWSWDTIDQEATIAKNTRVDEKGNSNADVVRKDLKDFFDRYYALRNGKKNTPATRHRNVIEAYTESAKESASCRAK
ncbi:hypothetical protein SMACR_09416 [Sordaria macrospora]|uniref:WGS project CABT00000000 data, contig 2.90 n=2 Tax=Sordaria macrospora TaxID=5147 RepID=F7WBZ4_SORMK|nr:uncharacterized protein SMAC_09416 [Sordaria macrospora k-hell]KAA8622113.1 hypothetical protein SMACR_09416 [Sordaria macrospora]WPJ60374.1 hypothetical protein SMAC4_09416 [Sordaria macrospora]CCC14516.1 unnamed protein product [Sordaria macrospora k-hell]